MHLLTAAQAGSADVEEAVDLGQGPAPVVVLSAADSELACLAEARARCREPLPEVRLANLTRLTHPLSVDLYVEKVVAHARFVLVRMLGGRGYWPYGLEQIEATCREAGIALAVVPGDDRPDAELDRLCSVPSGLARALWGYLAQGGLANAEHCLRRIAAFLGEPVTFRDPVPLPRAGLYRTGEAVTTLESVRARRADERPRALLLFYRAWIQSGDVAAVDAVAAALDARGIETVPVYVASLKDHESAAVVESVLDAVCPDLVLDTTAFAVSAPGGARCGPLAGCDAPVLQLVLAGRARDTWAADSQGLGPRDLAMHVVLPEVDGCVLTRAVAFKEPARFDEATQCHLQRYVPDAGRIGFVADLAANWVRLRRTPAGERRVAVVLANYPSRDGRLANGVGLDTPQSVVEALRAMQAAGYRVEACPGDGDALIGALRAGPTNQLDDRSTRQVAVSLPLAAYHRRFSQLPDTVRQAVIARWGPPEDDPHLTAGAFALSALTLGNIVVGIQPARGYHIDPVATYHSPDLVPPHGYFAFYFWLRDVFRAHAVVHFGKHGNLEWLPGKALALSETCLPEVALGPLPHFYPFIVNDPGEGSQAKRRTQAVILDHLTPPLARAESYGPLRELERLVDEYFEAAQLDRRRTEPLARDILAWASRLGLDRDLALDAAASDEEKLAAIDGHLCELKELQIRDGLHIFGRSPTGAQRAETLVAMLRLPRSGRSDRDASLLRALAADLGLDDFDPLDCVPEAPWQGPRPAPLQSASADPWRTAGDTLERLERLALALVAGSRTPDATWTATLAVLDYLNNELAPTLDGCGEAEIRGLLRGLDGRFVDPGPSGAPTRGRPDILPTGRNFYSVDTRGVPTPAAFELGWKAAQRVLEHHAQTHGEWPKAIALSAWGTANMRTGGEDIAEALAFLGCRPLWERGSGRVTGVEVLPASLLDRPRIDVTFRVSGFFRDAFPAQIELLDDAIRAVAALDEPEEINPLAAAARAEADALVAAGLSPEQARRRATLRIFGSKPGAYGAGLQALIDEGIWHDRGDLADAWLAWSGWAYGRTIAGEHAHDTLEQRLSGVQLVLHNQDNREHDILDSDDYYQFLGGLAAAVEKASGRRPEVLFGDHSRPETPRVRSLELEIGRVVRARAANPKWIRGVMRHGYKGGFEIAATVDYLFAFAATTGLVRDHHFDALFEAYVEDEEVRTFLAQHNPDALREIAARFAEAVRRALWRPRSNRASMMLDELTGSQTGGEGG